MSDTPTFAGWAVLELMGHRRLGGYVQEAQVAGAGFLRIDVPADVFSGDPEATQFYPPSSVYCLTPTSEAAARAVAKSNRPAPVHRYELPAWSAPSTPECCTDCGDDLVEGETGRCANCKGEPL